MRIRSFLLTIIISLGLNFGVFAQIETQTRFIVKGKIAPETFLGVPVMVQSFEDGGFVVREYRNNSLKLFSKEGEYIRNLSQRGRGPGENLQIESIYINNDNELLIVDHIQMRISIFSKEKHLRDLNLFSTRPDINSIHQKSDGSYLVNSHLAGSFLFFEWSKDFKDTGNRYVLDSELQVDGQRLLSDALISILTKSTILTSQDDLIVAPPFYTGKLLIYRKQDKYRSNDIVKTREYGQPFEKYEGNVQSLNMETMRKELLHTSSGPEGPTAYYHFNRSLGLFELSTGEILHLAQIWDRTNERVKLMAELLNKGAKELIGTYELIQVGELNLEDYVTEGAKNDRIELSFLHMDDNDNLYISAQDKNMEPELHVVNIRLQ